ncbi:MAG: hypothetical protein AB7P12_07075, partial [Alphaproteobacteria bacterium]
MNIDDDLLQRIARVRKVMGERGIGSLIVYYGGQHNMLRLDPVLLLADYRVIGPAALILGRSGRPLLIVTPKWDEPRARESVSVCDIQAVEESTLAPAIAAAVRELEPPLALVGREVMPLAFSRALN